MPNIPPLASNVVKSKYFASLILFAVYVVFIYTMPKVAMDMIYAGIAGWFIGRGIYNLSQAYENILNK